MVSQRLIFSEQFLLITYKAVPYRTIRISGCNLLEQFLVDIFWTAANANTVDNDSGSFQSGCDLNWIFIAKMFTVS